MHGETLAMAKLPMEHSYALEDDTLRVDQSQIQLKPNHGGATH